MGIKKKTSAPALDKGLHILEELAHTHEPVTMTHIAGQMGVSVSSIQRILAELVQQGYVGKTATNGYYLTDRVYKLAAARETEESLLSCSMEPMHEYVSKTTESIHISIARAGQFVVIGQVNSTELVRLSIREGSYPIVDYPSGWVLMAFGAKEAWVGTTIPPELQRHIDEARKKGYGFTESKVRTAIYHLSVPVRGNSGVAIGALATSFAMRKEGFTDIRSLTDYLLGKLKEAASQIERKISS